MNEHTPDHQHRQLPDHPDRRVILRGELVTPERCQAAIAVAQEVFPEATVVADLTISVERRGSSDPERL